MPRGARTVLPLAVLAGLAVALAVTLLQPDVHRASGAVLLAAPGAPPRDDGSLDAEARAAAELLESRVVAESAATNLAVGLSASDVLDRVDARAREGSSVVRLSVEDGDADRARRIAQEVAEVFVALFNDRFGEAATASIWDPPRAEEGRVSPRPVRNLALGALAGLLAGVAYLALAARRGQTRDASVPARRGAWTLAELERRVAAAPPGQAEERRRMLAAVRDFAGEDGALPPALDGLLAEVFGGAPRAPR